jgi:plastocyanin
MSRWVLGIVAATVVVTLAPSLLAAEVVITQENKTFSEKAINIKRGDVVRFVNKDDIVHDVHSTTEGYDFDLGSQQPGTETSYTFARPGQVKVRCAIHPKMKLDVVVE